MKKQNKEKNQAVVNYPVGDFLIRLKNSALAGRGEIVVRKNKQIKKIASALKKEGYLNELLEKEGRMVVSLAFRNKKPVLSDIKLVSRPGLRIYMNVSSLAKKRGPTLFLISTSKGIVTSKEAIKNRIGGEIIAEVL